MRFVRRKKESFERMRRRLLRETEVILHFGLRFPDRIPRIPTVEVGKDRFDPDFSSQYWSHRLGLKSNGVLK